MESYPWVPDALGICNTLGTPLLHCRCCDYTVSHNLRFRTTDPEPIAQLAFGRLWSCMQRQRSRLTGTLQHQLLWVSSASHRSSRRQQERPAHLHTVRTQKLSSSDLVSVHLMNREILDDLFLACSMADAAVDRHKAPAACQKQYPAGKHRLLPSRALHVWEKHMQHHVS